MWRGGDVDIQYFICGGDHCVPGGETKTFVRLPEPGYEQDRQADNTTAGN